MADILESKETSDTDALSDHLANELRRAMVSANKRLNLHDDFYKRIREIEDILANLGPKTLEHLTGRIKNLEDRQDGETRRLMERLSKLEQWRSEITMPDPRLFTADSKPEVE